jgi:hypothetical protein
LYAVDGDELHDKYKIFKTQISDELEKQFDQENQYRTSIRGLKIRGVFNDRRDAEEHAKLMRQTVEPVHVFVGPVGSWLPWDPDPDCVQNSDYMVPQLNELMHKYHDNVHSQKREFDERKSTMIEEAQLDTKEKRRQNMYKKLAEKKQRKIEYELRERKRELAKEEASIASTSASASASASASTSLSTKADSEKQQ